jgi:PKD repeat protein
LVVPAGGYLIVTSDPAAFMGEYSGTYSVVKSSITLNNTGTTVSLIDGSGATLSSFAYTSSMGGTDNGTSLQDAGGGTWVSALPTPGAPNATQSYTPPEDEEDEGSSNTVAAAAVTQGPGYVAPPLPQLFADAGENRTVVVGADTRFVASAYDRSRDVINYAKFLWNFGDGTTAEGPSVMHHFSYPGRYAVELTITNDAHTSSSRITVTAEPASVLLERLPQGGVALKNLSGRDLDLSFWRVVEGEHVFVLPEHSVVLKDASLNIAAKALGFFAVDPVLQYPNGTEVAPPQEAAPELVAKPAPYAAASAIEQKPAASAVPAVASTAPATTTPVALSDTSSLAASAGASTATFPLWASVSGLGGIVGLGVMSVWYTRRRQGTGEETNPPVEEFAIEE